jgi:hypothetical protein
MLEQTEKKGSQFHFGAKVLVIRGRRFSNSAAKFWSALIDEVLAEYADCESVVLQAANEGRLEPTLLFPEIELERELNGHDFGEDSLHDAWQRALDDYELYGPPGSVEIRIYSFLGKPRRFMLPMDCVDAELFLYLLVWLMEWADLPAGTWNEGVSEGSFEASDPYRKLNYKIHFLVEHIPLKEGLFIWKLKLKFERHSYMPVIPAQAGIQSDFSLDSHFPPSL